MASILNVSATKYNQVYEFTLDSTVYTIHVYWNYRSGWYLSLYDNDDFDETTSASDDALILGGRKIVRNQNMFVRCTDSRLPAGQLWCYDSEFTDDDETVDLDNFGSDERFRLLYLTEDDVEDFIEEYS